MQLSTKGCEKLNTYSREEPLILEKEVFTAWKDRHDLTGETQT